MKLKTLKIMMLVSVLLCWLVIGVNVYDMTKSGSATFPEYSIVGRVVEQGEELVQGDDNVSVVEQLLGEKATERPSPCNRVDESQIFVMDDQIVIDFKNAEWATFTDTNSMDPVLDTEANALEYVPTSPDEICLGDIASYHTDLSDGIVIHRIVEIGYDDDGWYAIFKGDNLPYKDPEKVRFDQIERVVIGIIY